MDEQRVHDIFNTESPFEFRYVSSVAPANPLFHFHESYEICLIEAGTFNQYVESSRYVQRTKSISIFRSNELHKFINPNKTSVTRMILHFNPVYVRQFSTNLTDLLLCFTNRPLGIDNVKILTDEHFEAFRSLFLKGNDAFRNDEYGNDITALSCFLELLVLVNKIYTTSQSELSSFSKYSVLPIVDYIDRNYKSPLSLEKIAQALSLNKFYLSHSFKKETGSTIFQYILLRRIATAKNLLMNGASVTETCEEAGFGDYSSFIRTFKRETGYSPAKFKNLFH